MTVTRNPRGGAGIQAIGFNTDDSSVLDTQVQPILGAHTSWSQPIARVYRMPRNAIWSRMVLVLAANTNTIDGARFFSTVNDIEPVPTIVITVDQATGNFDTEDDTTVTLALVRGDEPRWEYAQGDSSVAITTIAGILS